MKTNISKGKAGEKLAAEYLQKRGFSIVETNWRYSRSGEIDIIAIDKNALVFVEVKTRSSISFGLPIESITETKMNRMKTLAGIYLSEKPDIKFKNFRFDVVGIILNKVPEITYYKDVYQF